MSMFPQFRTPPPPTITPFHDDSIGRALVSNNFLFAGAVSAVYITANMAFYVPFILSESFPLKRMFVHNGATASGATDLGIFTNEGHRIVSASSSGNVLTQAGVSVIQYYDLTDTTLTPGQYFMAISHSDIVGTVFRSAPQVNVTRQYGVFQQATAHPLPVTATFAPMTSIYMPMFGLSQRTF